MNKTIKKFQTGFLTSIKPKRLFKTFAIIACLLIAGAFLTLGGNVIVRDGQLNVTSDFFVGTGVLFVDSAGSKVGIGTTGPDATLEVINGTNAGGFMVSSAAEANGDLFIVDEAGKVGIGTTSPTEKLSVNGNVSLNDTLYVTEAGNVGIGTTSPTSTLHVVGDANLTGGNLTVDGDITFTGELHGSVLINCPSDMVRVGGQGGYCIDRYEASDSGVTTAVDLNGDGDTNDAVLLGIEYICEDGSADGSGSGNESANCMAFNKAQSVYNQTPYVSITQAQAKASCLAAEKHLCTDYEWWIAAQGTPDYNTADPTNDAEECNIWSNSKPSEATWSVENQATKTGTAARCVSDHGAFDMVGNVWEWTADTAYWNMDYPVATTGTVYIKGREITGNQYIAGVDDYGIPNAWNAAGQTAFNNDYNWDGGVDGAYGISDIFSSGTGEGRPISAFIRGGSWGAGASAGVFALSLGGAPSHSDPAIGFRCCK